MKRTTRPPGHYTKDEKIKLQCDNNKLINQRNNNIILAVNRLNYIRTTIDET
jgi:hypothetical protein